MPNTTIYSQPVVVGALGSQRGELRDAQWVGLVNERSWRVLGGLCVHAQVMPLRASTQVPEAWPGAHANQTTLTPHKLERNTKLSCLAIQCNGLMRAAKQLPRRWYRHVVCLD
jgi:hypothetical protein